MKNSEAGTASSTQPSSERHLHWMSMVQLVLVIIMAILIVIHIAFPGHSDAVGKKIEDALNAGTMILLILLILSTLLHYDRERRLRKNLEAQEKTYRSMAEKDDLTNLYNRRAAIAYLKTIPPEDDYTVLLMNVDKFKDINEVYGHDFGDHVLKVIAAELLNYMKAFQGFTARYGSDEFLIVFRGAMLSESSEIIEHLRDIIHEPIEIGLANIVPTVCIGAAWSDKKSSAETIANHAEIAVRESKRKGRRSFTIFTSDLQDQIQETMNLKLRIQDAIKNDGFYMVYQPKVDTFTLDTVGYEALVRMKGNDVSPSVFIPIAEENGWLREIGRITTEKAIQQIAEWRKKYDYHLPVSINFSGVQIRDHGYFYFLLDTLAKYDVPSNLVEIELTEGVMLQYTKETIDLMNRFHAAGIRLALDDFGTGYSSLSYLNQFPLDIIKIDKSFVAANIKDAKKRAILADMIHLGHDLSTKIVVEGVETREQYEYIRKMDADIIQGFYFSKPLKPDQAISFRAHHNDVHIEHFPSFEKKEENISTV